MGFEVWVLRFVVCGLGFRGQSPGGTGTAVEFAWMRAGGGVVGDGCEQIRRGGGREGGVRLVCCAGSIEVFVVCALMFRV